MWEEKQRIAAGAACSCPCLPLPEHCRLSLQIVFEMVHLSKMTSLDISRIRERAIATNAAKVPRAATITRVIFCGDNRANRCRSNGSGNDRPIFLFSSISHLTSKLSFLTYTICVYAAVTCEESIREKSLRESLDDLTRNYIKESNLTRVKRNDLRNKEKFKSNLFLDQIISFELIYFIFLLLVSLLLK